ncbi:SsrA-binding protein [Flavobacterium sp.]|nr:SsrA-binding protein [Flavobacterium sp.]MDD3004086.1 SsrA-binding protein [Flavobacterium sp.]
MFKIVAKLNKLFLPSYTKQQLDLSMASNFQKAIIAWRYFVTTRALKQ